MRKYVMVVTLFSSLLASGFLALGAVPDALRDRSAVQKIHASLRAPGRQANVLVRLEDPPLIRKAGANAKQLGLKLDRKQQATYARGLREKQDEVVRLIESRGGRVVGRMTVVLNAVLAVVSTDQLSPISELGTVQSIRPVVDSELRLATTLPRVAVTPLHTAGITGEGVRVALLDSGVDYTHKNLGGPGTVEAYEAAYGTSPADPKNTTRDALFPTTKVVGGWDFVGEVWPLGPGGFGDPITPDEDPIDFESHGTHVADILAGRSADGTHVGVAPDTALYAFKVCSAVSDSCNGFATFLGLEAALHPDNPSAGLDPDYEGIIENPVDVVNMSLGADYGQIQDDKAYVAQLLTEFGITVVTAAGNGGDRPYIHGSPGVAPGSISVAETEVPDAKAFAIRVFVNGNRITSTIANTASLSWAPVDRTVTGVVAYLGRGCEGDAYPISDALISGKMVIIDRGACDISEKVDRAARAGAVGVILANNVPGDPTGFSVGVGSVFVPSLVISQADGNALKATVANPVNRVRATFGPTVFTSLAGAMATTSSRGPSYSFQTIKPDLSAPGASVSAIAGSGNQQESFSGTSGSSPMVAGAAALLQSASLRESGSLWSPWALKALLMNNAEPAVLLNPVTRPGVLAPITRAGSGELRVHRSLAARAVAVVVDPPLEEGGSDDIQASLSFGYHGLIGSGPWSVSKEISVLELAGEDRTFSVSSSFRYADDESNGAVAVAFSSPTVDVPAYGVGSVTMTVTVDPLRLPAWTLNGGTQGANGELLRLLEYDGHVRVQDARDTLVLPWHLLPRKASDLAAGGTEVTLTEGAGNLQVSNVNGATSGVTEIFALVGESAEDFPKPDAWGGDMALPDLKAIGARAVGQNLELAFALHHEWSHPVTPAECTAYLDVNLDTVEDFVLYTGDATGNGQTTVTVQNLNTGVILGHVFADADLNASVLIMRVPLAALGLTSASTLAWYATAHDNFFTGQLTDAIFDQEDLFLVQKLNQPKFAVAGSATRSVPVAGSVDLTISAPAGGAEASPSQTGLLLLHRQARAGRWSDVIHVVP